MFQTYSDCFKIMNYVALKVTLKAKFIFPHTSETNGVSLLCITKQNNKNVFYASHAMQIHLNHVLHCSIVSSVLTLLGLSVVSIK